MTLTGGSRLFHVSLSTVFLVACVVGGYLWGSSRPNPAFEAWLASAQQELAATKHWLARDRAARLEAGLARTEAATLALGYRDLREQLDSATQRALAAARTPRESLTVRTVGERCAAVVQNCEGRVAHWALADTLDAQRADVNAAGWAHADSVIKAGVAAQECRVNLLVARLGCPSRTTTFFAGAGIVELLHLIVGK